MSLRKCALLVVGALALVACRTEADVTVELAEDGSGELTVAVVLDPDAAAAIGGPEGLVLTDLESTGWDIAGPEQAEDGAITVSAAHGFADDEELADLLDAVAGPGVFSNVTFELDEPFGSTSWAAGLDVEVSGDPAQFSDEALTEVLGGLPLGRTPEELAEEGATAPGAATLTVEMSLFGQDSDSAELDLTSGEASSASLAVEHSRTQVLVYVLAATAGVLLVASLVFGLLAFRRRRR